MAVEGARAGAADRDYVQKVRAAARVGARLVAGVTAWLVIAGCVGADRPDVGSDTAGTGGPDFRTGIVTVGVPDISADLVGRLRQYQNTRSAGLQGWLGDELLITTRFGNTNQLHRVHAPLGARAQMTYFDEPIGAAAIPPGATDGFVYSRDAGGSEFYQLFWFDVATGSSRLLTDGKSRYGQVVWANGGDRFAYTSTERNGRDWDIFIQDRAGDAMLALQTNAGAWGAEDFSPDDERLLVSLYLSINESYVYELDLSDGARTPLLDPSLKASIGAARYSGDGEAIYFTADVGAEFMRLHRIDRATRDIEVLTADVPWNVEGFEVSPDGRWLAYSINEHGASKLALLSLPDHGFVSLPELPAGVVTGLAFDRDSSKLALSINNAASPTDVWTVDIVDKTLTRWTRSEVGGLDTEALTPPQLIEYPTFDTDTTGRNVPAFVFRPAGDGPHPVIVLIHGGPEAQYRPYFSSTPQFLVNELGVAVIAPNVRGSNGYGKSYLKLDNGRLREDSVKDIGALLDWIDARDEFDSDAVAVLGGSYGGYMVLASLVHFGDRLAAGIERVGISNFVTFLENTQDYRRDLRRAEYGDERDPDMRAFLESISPLNHVDRINRPLMISQGANDPRVPQSESEQIVAALEDADVPVWYVLALDEGHGFRKKNNRDFNTAVTMEFVQRFLLERR